MAISDKKLESLRLKLQELGIKEEDLEETFVSGAKKGGQKANKSSVVVNLKHKPTSIVIKCAQSREREENRFFARRLLIEKYEKEILNIKSVHDIKLERIRKQKKRRSRRNSSSQ